MNKSKILIDTDVMIDFLRGNKKATKYIKSKRNSIILSTVTVAELYSGVRNGKEKEFLDTFVDIIDTASVSVEIAIDGGFFKREFFKSHGTGLADALIAATAQHCNANLQTLNVKHFPMIKGIKAPYKK